MKIFTKRLRNLALLLLLGTASLSEAQNCIANFSWTAQANGVVTFTSTSVLSSTVMPTNYYWTFGNGQTYTATGSAGMNAMTTYTANGTYVVTLFILTAPSCSNAVQYTITISNSTGCGLNANFGYSQGSNGLVNFNNTTTGTTGGTTYSWNFGDASSPSTATSPSHNYAANGSYVVTMVATNNSTCTSTKTLMVNVSSFCNVNASFTTSNGSNGQVNFQSTSTGTNAGSMYHWRFGDGNQTWGGPSISHTYVNGSYNATLIVTGNTVTTGCADTTSQAVSVTNATCNLVPSFAYSNGTGGVVNFNSTSTGTNSSTTYTWNFGNGFTSNSASPTVTYLSGGSYWVTLQVSNGSGCAFTISQTVSVTSIGCVANANFTLVPTNTPQYWTAIPAYPWNVAMANWSWGDNTSTTFSMYAAHQYSAAGMYNICLTVTATCGATATACQSYSVYRTSQPQAIINVNVLPPDLKSVDAVANPVGLISHSDLTGVYEVYPNPNSGSFMLNISGISSDKVDVSIYNLVGELVYNHSSGTSNGAVSNEVNLNNASTGVYFVQIKTENNTVTRRIVVNK